MSKRTMPHVIPWQLIEKGRTVDLGWDLAERDRYWEWAVWMTVDGQRSGMLYELPNWRHPGPFEVHGRSTDRDRASDQLDDTRLAIRSLLRQYRLCICGHSLLGRHDIGRNTKLPQQCTACACTVGTCAGDHEVRHDHGTYHCAYCVGMNFTG